ncbi:heavy metal translocating P-type ATPase [Daejeonella lutea]|uniref:Cu+-exporting ATPase n=1 Tax=Daejeonella lutea TaxID=572036 RepID=A0A1T5A4J0_9SPHI|nr:heavy metal translocating P-type ATPase metal-binding domain-containing protein [Daejeonella lutea]SKB29866.1 Cu+-exporting ATPase [Daejeonella lutea]
MNKQVAESEKCYHCGTEINGTGYIADEKEFCCIGCKSVYQILSARDMCSYYSYNDSPGQAQLQTAVNLDYLDEPSIVSKLTDYNDEQVSSITFYVPGIQCSSCIWLLEHLHKFNKGVVHSRIDFLKKQVAITFRNQEISLKELVMLMISVGYEPLISLQDVVKEKKDSVNRSLIKRIAVAGFCMGNVMLLSFPEYFGMAEIENQFRILFGWMNLAFAIPVTFYCGREFFQSAWAGLKHKIINLDAPLALIIAVLFLRSAFEIISGSGPGFTDTLTGLVFLLLMGRWVKQRTYSHLSFKRDYRSYFPVAVTLIREKDEVSLALEDLKVGDRILVRNNEIIPADAILMKGDALADFSFVTGEAVPIPKVLGEILYAGGRQLGEAIELEVIKPVSQSYLTSLWNNEAFTRPVKETSNFNDSIARYFGIVTLIIAFTAGTYWAFTGDSVKAWTSFTAVLIVACPCVLSLSTPFTLSGILSIFDKHLFYLKSPNTVEQLAQVNTLVFDKTGTITSPDSAEVNFTGDLSDTDKLLTASLARNSAHPLSQKIIQKIRTGFYLSVLDFKEIPGKGISGIINGNLVKLGSPTDPRRNNSSAGSAASHLEVNGIYKGYFKIGQYWRSGLRSLFDDLAQTNELHVISGDNEADKEKLSMIIPNGSEMHFRQSPLSKLNYVKSLQEKGKNVMMIGDGLNDAGALQQSDLGVAVTDNINTFSPACDAILNGKSTTKIPAFIRLSKDALNTIKASFIISGTYNIIGVYFAVQGLLSPLLAAVLMPLSTISVILFTSAATRYYAAKNHLL